METTQNLTAFAKNNLREEPLTKLSIATVARLLGYKASYAIRRIHGYDAYVLILCKVGSSDEIILNFGTTENQYLLMKYKYHYIPTGIVYSVILNTQTIPEDVFCVLADEHELAKTYFVPSPEPIVFYPWGDERDGAPAPGTPMFLSRAQEAAYGNEKIEKIFRI